PPGRSPRSSAAGQAWPTAIGASKRNWKWRSHAKSELDATPAQRTMANVYPTKTARRADTLGHKFRDVCSRGLSGPRSWQRFIGSLLLLALAAAPSGLAQDEVAVPLPEGVKTAWEIKQAYHDTTPTRERICLNGLWRWQPAKTSAESVPAGNW